MRPAQHQIQPQRRPPAPPEHRHSLGPEHDHEPQRGLPEVLPHDERLLWQGSPDWKAMAVRVFHVRKLALYFAALLALRVGFDLADGRGLTDSLAAVTGLSLLAALALALMTLMAWLSASQAVYTLTSKRVVMRIGIVLTVTYNLPFKQISGAALLRHRGGTGDLPLTLAEGQRIAYLQLWPHARPWMLRRTQPMLRCVPEAERVAALLVQAWSQSVGAAAVPGAPAAAAVAADAAGADQAADASRMIRPVLVTGRAG